MRKTTKRLLSFLMAATMLLSMIPVVSANVADKFSDFPTGWSEPAMRAAVENGLLAGYENENIRPKGKITRAEVAAVIVRAFAAVTEADISSFVDVKESDWFYESIKRAVKMGAVSGMSETIMAPNAPITREQAFAMLARVLVLTGNDETVLDKFNDGDEVSAWARNSVAALAERGYVAGDEKGNVNPKANITREEFAQMMYASIRSYITVSGTYTNDREGIVVVRVGDVTFKNLTITGDLVIGDGVMRDSISISNTNITGRLLTRGGTITVVKPQIGEALVVNNVNGVTEFNNYRSEFETIIENTVAKFKTVQTGGGSGGGGGPQPTVPVTTPPVTTPPVTTPPVTTPPVTTPPVTTPPVTTPPVTTPPVTTPPVTTPPVTTPPVTTPPVTTPPVTTPPVTTPPVTTPPVTTPPVATEITVSFYEGYGSAKLHIEDVTLNSGETSIDKNDIPATGKGPVLYDKANYLPAEYLGLYNDDEDVYRVSPSFWYEKGGKLVEFNEKVVLTEDTDVYLLYKEFSVTADLDAALIGSAPRLAISARYNENSRVIDSLKILAASTGSWLDTAIQANLPIYNQITNKIYSIAENKNIITDEKEIKLISIGIDSAEVMNRSTIDGYVRTYIRGAVKTHAHLDEMLDTIDIAELALELGIAQTSTKAEIIAYADTLDDDGKQDFADLIYDQVVETVQYDDIAVAFVTKGKDIRINDGDVEIAQLVSNSMRLLDYDTVIGYLNIDKFEKIIDFIGVDIVKELVFDAKEELCDRFDAEIEKVANDVADETFVEPVLNFRFNIVEILDKVYDNVQPKAEAKLNAFGGVKYNENKYLQYLVNHDMIDMLFDTTTPSEGTSGYVLKSELEYYNYILGLIIATDDALCWYGDINNMSEAEFEAVYSAAFAKVGIVNDKLTAILEDFSEDGLPEQIENLLTKVQQINNLFAKIEPKLRTIIDKYLGSSVNDKISSGELAENAKVQNAIDILFGKEEPVFTIDSLYNIFYQYDDKMQSALKKALASSELRTAIAKFEASEIGEKFTGGAESILDVLTTIANEGIDKYKVTTTDITVVDEYRIKIANNEFIIKRALRG